MTKSHPPTLTGKIETPLLHGNETTKQAPARYFRVAQIRVVRVNSERWIEMILIIRLMDHLPVQEEQERFPVFGGDSHIQSRSIRS